MVGTRQLMYETTYSTTESALANCVFLHILKEKGLRREFEECPRLFVVNYIAERLYSADKKSVEEAQERNKIFVAEVANNIQGMLELARKLK